MGSTTSSTRNQGSRNANAQNKAQTAACLQTRLLDPRSPTTTVARTPLSSSSHYTRITEDGDTAPRLDLTESCDEVDKRREMDAVNDMLQDVRQSEQKQKQQGRQGSVPLLDAISEQEHEDGEEHSGADNDEDERSISASPQQQAEEQEAAERAHARDEGAPAMAESMGDGSEGPRYVLLDDTCTSPSSDEENARVRQTHPSHTLAAAAADAPSTALQVFSPQRSATNSSNNSSRMKRQTPLGERTNLAPALRA